MPIRLTTTATQWEMFAILMMTTMAFLTLSTIVL